MRAHSIETRRLGTADTDAFRAILVEALERHPDAFWSSPEEEIGLPYAEALKRMEEAYVVGGFLDGALAGIAVYVRRPFNKLRHKGVLAILYVREAARGTGLADALMERVADRAGREAEELILNVAAGNERAIRFYRRWGFEAYGVEPRCVRLPSGECLDEVLMAKRLR
jgi:ribosomal protein S18 acetylase RimI-like enzyme